MAQKNNKQPNNANKSDIDVINPENFTASQLKDLDAKTNAAKEALEKELNNINKEIRGKLWIWWFLPIFGWLIYAMIMQNRLQQEENMTKLVLIKRQIAEKQIQLVLDQKRWDQLNGNKH